MQGMKVFLLLIYFDENHPLEYVIDSVWDSFRNAEKRIEYHDKKMTRYYKYKIREETIYSANGIFHI